MKQTKDMSIRLTVSCIFLFAAVLLAADVSAFRWIRWYVEWRGMRPAMFARLMAVFYAASVAGWFCLRALYRLLQGIWEGQVFCDESVANLRSISRCCAVAAAIFLAGGFFYAPLFIPAAAAAFMMLIVRIVKNIFEQAIAMKSELDLTI